MIKMFVSDSMCLFEVFAKAYTKVAGYQIFRIHCRSYYKFLGDVEYGRKEKNFVHCTIGNRTIEPKVSIILNVSNVEKWNVWSVYLVKLSLCYDAKLDYVLLCSIELCHLEITDILREPNISQCSVTVFEGQEWEVSHRIPIIHTPKVYLFNDKNSTLDKLVNVEDRYAQKYTFLKILAYMHECCKECYFNYVIQTANCKGVFNLNPTICARTTYSDKKNGKKQLDIAGKETDIKLLTQVEKSKSLTSLKQSNDHNIVRILKYIFGDPYGTYGNRVYCVGYFTVHSDPKNDISPSKSSKENTNSSKSSVQSEFTQDKHKLCGENCSSKDTNVTFTRSLSDLLEKVVDLVNIRSCQDINCNARSHERPGESMSPGNEKLLIDMFSMSHECCDITEKIEQVIGEVKAEMKVGDDPCYCTCECTFGFTKKTTYCNVCGGYEQIGEEISPHQLSLPCPIFHKLVDKNKLKTCSSGSDSKRKGTDSQKSHKTDKKSAAGDKSTESEKDNKKSKKKNKDSRFKFNYGYQAPKIGHSQCAMPCTGTLGFVPKHMGWMWTAEDIPGLKFRPLWKPGATNKQVVRLLKMARYPGQVISKKRRKDGTKKRPLKRPLLVVHKKEGEYTVTMETMKAFSKPRTINQQPYDDKPLVTYTIGRSDEENRERLKRKERAQRRLEKEQRAFIQSTFQDVCKDICLKTYQQALGILPGAEDPGCTCFPAGTDVSKINADKSCSCSYDSKSILTSDTDSDEWIIEFTPPNAYFNPSYKGKKVFKVDNSTQYTYLDFRVKLLDRYGNPVPRFFKGSDGKQQCSDLGGFWDPQHNWLEINSDGFIAPDGRWAPNSFFGPNGEQVDAEGGKFQAANGKWLVVGIDGYVDSHDKWRFYAKPRQSQMTKKKSVKVVSKDKKGATYKAEPMKTVSETTWSCFGDATPKELAKLGIVGHGMDRKLLIATLKEMIARGEDVKIPESKQISRSPKSKRHDASNNSKVQYNQSAQSGKGAPAVDADGNKVCLVSMDAWKKLLKPQPTAAMTQRKTVAI